jgi:PAS domain S-box-containing protein
MSNPKKLEQELRKMTDLLKAIGEMAKVGGWELDIETNKVVWSDETYRIHEVSFDFDPSVDDAINFFHPDDRLVLKEAMKNAREKATPYDLLLRLKTAKGNNLITRSICNPFVKEGKVVKLTGTFQDVTDWKRAEQKLQSLNQQLSKSERKFKQLVETASDAIYMMDVKGFIIETNQMATQMLGKNRSEIIGQPINKIDPNFSIESFMDFWEDVPYDEQKIFESTHITKDGKLIPVELSSKKFLLQGKTYFYGIARDISLRKKERELLLASESRFRSYVDNAPDGIFICNEKGKYVEVNPAACTITGFSKEELLQKNAIDLIPNSAKESGLRHFKKVQDIGAADTILPFTTKEGEFRYWQIAAVKLSETRFLGFVKDVTEEKLIRDELFASQADIQSLLENSGIAFTLLNPDMTIKVFNQKANTNAQFVFGKSMEKGQSILDFTFPENQNHFIDDFNQCLTGEKISIDMGFPLQKPQMWFDFTFDPVKNSKGEVVGVLFSALDITGRKSVEEKLRENETRLKNIVEYSTNLFYTHSVDHEITYVSPQVIDYLGYSKDEVSNRWTDYLTDNPINQQGIAYTKKAIETGKRQPTYEVEMKRKNGSIIVTEVREAPLIVNGEVVSIVGSLTDITDRKKAEFELKEAHTFANKIANSTPALMYIYDYEKQKNIWSNALHAKFFKNLASDYPEMDYKTIAECVPGEDFAKILKKSEEMNADPQKNSFSIDIRIHTNPWQWKWMTLLVSAFKRNKEGQLQQTIGALFDISERKKAEFELLKAKKKAEESDRLKSAFLANMSHEIRTPMNGILGFANLLKQPNLSGEENKQYVDIILKSGERMLNIINDIVDISKIESGTMEMKMMDVDVNEQMNELFAFFKPEAKSKGLDLRLKLDLSAQHSICETDGEKMAAVLTNLIKNAIKYTDAGSIEMACEYISKDHKPYLKFSVKDTGIGIAKERQKAIFDRFIQADIDDVYARQGAGLGLSISKAYIDMLDGEIHVESEKGKGSHFYFLIPWKSEKSKHIQTKKAEESTEDSPSSDLKIVVAEDDDISRNLISIILKDYAKEIIFTDNGEQTVEICQNNPDIDLVLMDIRMPGMNGYEATARIREFNKDLIIIAQTAYGLADDREKALACGCSHYISKPIKKDELVQLVQSCFM